MSSVLRLSMVSLIPLLTELLSSQLQDRHTLPEPQNPRLRRLRLMHRHRHRHTPSQRLPGSHSPTQSSCASEVTHLHGGPSVLAGLDWQPGEVAATYLPPKAGSIPEQRWLKTHPCSTSLWEMDQSPWLLPRPSGRVGTGGLETRLEGSEIKSNSTTLPGVRVRRIFMAA